MNIKVFNNRKIYIDESNNTQNENDIETLKIEVPEEYKDFYKKIVFITPNGIVWDSIEDDSYTLKRSITQYESVSFYIWLTNGEQDFRSVERTLLFNKNYSVNGEITPAEKTEMEMVLELLESEIDKVENMDLDVTKEGNKVTITITKKDGTEKSVQISDGEKGDKGDDYVITQEDYQEIADIVENQINIPAKTSDLTNDSGFITKLVNDLSNYYLKSETYTKTEVHNLIGQIGSIQFQVINELPLTGNSSYIYLVPSSNPTTQNIKDEYIWVNNAWEQIGSTDVELSNYQTKIDSSHKLNSDLVDDTNQTNKFVTSTEKTTWNNKSNFSGSYNDLTDKPTIPNEITESTVSGWGFTKNVGTITEITMNGSSKGTSGAVDLGTVITSHQDISGKENISNKVTSLSTSSTDTQYPSAKAVYDELEDIKAVLDENDIKETENWLKGWFAITTNNDHHGCEWYPFSTSNTTSVERLYNSVGLSITPATDTIAQIDNLPEQFKSFSCNFFVDNEGVKHITAIKGMSNNYGETEDTIKNVVYKGITYKQDLGRVRRTRFYNFGLNSNSKFEYDFYWTPKDGYVPTPMAINKDGSISPFYVIASCVAGLDSDGQLRSLKGLRPAHYLIGTTTGTEDISTNICYSDCISLFHNRGQYYSAGLMCEYMDIALDYYLKFGTRDTQSIMKGNTSNNYQFDVSYAESNVSRVVLTTDQANNIDLLSCVSVGDRGSSTSTDRAYKYFHNIANDVRVIGKEIIDESHTALILDHAPFTTTSTTCVLTMHEVSGFSDYVLGDYGSPISNTNGRHGFVFDGIEISVGGYEVAGNAIMNIVSSTGKREIYITNDVSQLSSTYSTIQSTYNKSNLAIQPTTLSAWNYITKMEADLTNGLFVPTECGQSGSGSSVGFADGCYIASGTSGQREFSWLGCLYSNANAGLSCLNADRGITNASWDLLARLSINGVGGELAE